VDRNLRLRFGKRDRLRDVDLPIPQVSKEGLDCSAGGAVTGAVYNENAPAE